MNVKQNLKISFTYKSKFKLGLNIDIPDVLGNKFAQLSIPNLEGHYEHSEGEFKVHRKS